ncbi:hypothetical protein MNBD_GAMMA06-232 [hydrothermal vent metagenome]|uniref:N-acetyltransferase domain-containing protein n=1 Tax=hydrothermal vent metagenome TaxID=652676 RepID=A0A3B0W8F2_9ZZZZ
MFFKITQPEAEEEFKRYYHLRWQLLRAPWHQPKGSEIDDIEEQCFHVMAVDTQKNIIGIARLQFNSNSEAQIRYMAVIESHQKQGIGRELIKTMEQHAQKYFHGKIILDAREPAVDFYKKLGFRVVEKSYLLFDEIQHFRMIKNLG